tara:strand:+ start:3154 stop:3789 length:636 start_codon:yes stop_codon:yes gene_type:complete
MYQLMNGIKCLHVQVKKIDETFYASYGCVGCMTIDDFLHEVEKYFSYDPDGFVLLYLEIPDDIKEQVIETMMKFLKVTYVYGVEQTTNLKGKIGIIQNSKEHKIQTQKEYDDLILNTEYMNVVIHENPRKRWYIILNVVSGCLSCLFWSLAVFTAYLFWWMSFYGLVTIGTICLYVHNYVGFDNRQIYRLNSIHSRHQSIFLTSFYQSENI